MLLEVLTVAILQVLARAVEMFTSLGWFFGSLFFDRLSGAADSSSRVRYRAAQLRCLSSSPSHPTANAARWLMSEKLHMGGLIHCCASDPAKPALARKGHACKESPPVKGQGALS